MISESRGYQAAALSENHDPNLERPFREERNAHWRDLLFLYGCTNPAEYRPHPFSSARLNPSSDNDRSRLRRIPRSTSAT
jgi:hypothetical protein